MKKRSPKYREGSNLVQSRIPADQRQNAASTQLAQQLVNKAPKVDASVVSVFDARPINAIDFYRESFNTVITFVPVSALSFTVPFGKTAILREISWIIYPGGGQEPNNPINKYGVEMLSAFPVSGGITIDNIFDSQYQNIRSNIIKKMSVYILVPEGKTLAIKFTENSGFQYLVNVGVYGQLLENSGVAANYEPGTKNPLPVKTYM